MVSRLGLLMVIFLFVLASCKDNGSTDGPEETLEPRSFYAGVSGMVPPNYPNPTDDDWLHLFQLIPELGDYYGTHVGWNEGKLDSDGIPEVVQLAYDVTLGKGVAPYYAIGFEPDRLTQEEADEYIQTHGEDFKEVCRVIAQRYKPAVFLIGIEINRYYEKSPSGFDDFVEFYKETYDLIKQESPNTLVSTNFLLDYMKGDGYRSGAEHHPHWYLIDQFGGKLDIVTFTAFPFLDYDHPSDIPTDYLSEIQAHTNRPLMITETGWPSKNIAGITGNEDAQVVFLERMLEMMDLMPFHAFVWAFPHDPEVNLAGGIFDNISMRNNDGTPKKVVGHWEDLIKRPRE